MDETKGAARPKLKQHPENGKGQSTRLALP